MEKQGMADPVTKLHFAPNANLVNGTYAPGADGFTHQSIIKTTFLLYHAAVSAIAGG
jgi:hypothetical protein